MREVILMINGETIKINVSRVFRGENPITHQHTIYIMDDDSRKKVRLFCQDRMDRKVADTLVQKIRGGQITDLTGYLAEWNR